MGITSYLVGRVLENPDREGITKELCEQISERFLRGVFAAA
jgi:hypothetical protein